uniref:Adenylate kinase 7b n=1 Tax=Sinocyclocheilus anshuiensis TaxID=1608454 RepID=A0A671MFV7_9TELE
MFENVSFLRFLGSCVVGASLVDPGEADVEEEDDRLHNEQPKLKNATFQIVGTDYALDMRFFPFPPHQNLKREDLFCHLMKCDVIIYDITPHADQIDEAQWAVSGSSKMSLTTSQSHNTLLRLMIPKTQWRIS